MGESVAVCVRGQLRMYKSCVFNLRKYLIDPLGADVFVHTWREDGMGGEVDTKYLQDLYQTDNVVVEPYVKSDWLKLFDSIVRPECRHLFMPHLVNLPYWYKIKASWDQVKDSGKCYDIIIQIRPDMLVNERLPKYTLFDDSVLWHSDCLLDSSFQISDKFIVSIPKYIETYTKVIDELPHFWDKSYVRNEQNPLFPGSERLAFQVLHDRIPTATFSMDCKIKRKSELKEKCEVFRGKAEWLIRYCNYDRKDLMTMYNRFPYNIRRVLNPALSFIKNSYPFSGRPLSYIDGGCNPDFIGVGFPKSGTSWWYRMLLDHPSISDNRIHTKEVTFFPYYLYSDIPVDKLSGYRGLFGSDNGSLVGDYSPGYVFHPFVLEQIREHMPNVKLLAILRNPVDAMVSLVNQQMQVKRRIMQIHSDKLADYFRIFDVSPEAAYTFKYGIHLRKLFKLFGRDQVLLQQYEKCKLYPVREIQKTYNFLGVDDGFIPSSVSRKVNVKPYIVGKPSESERKRIASFYLDDFRAVKKFCPSFDMGLWRDFK